MASFTVTLPDGSSYTVDGLSEDATEADALAAVLAEHPDAADADNSLQQWMGVATRALLPYGVAAAGGAAAGAPLAGVGAAPGAAAGVLALGLGDLGAGAYNLAATPFGAPRMTLPSEAIRQTYEAAGGPGTRQPQTTPQRIVSAGLEAAAPAGGLAQSLNTLTPLMRQGVTRNVLTEMGRGVRAQTVGGAASGAATQAAIEGGETDPMKLFLVSLAGGVGGTLAGGRTPRPMITGEDIRDQARTFYRQAEQQGVFIQPHVADRLADDLEATLNRQGGSITTRDRAQVMRVIQDLRNRQNADLSFEELETLRSDLGNVGRSAETGKITAVGAPANRLANIVQDRLDEFFANLDASQVSAGDPRAAVRFVRQARQQYQNARKGEILDTVLSKVETNTKRKPAAQDLQDRLQPIVNDRRTMSKFTPAEREVLRSLQSGTFSENALKTAGALAPEFNVQKILGYAIPATAAASTQPEYLTALGAVGALSLGAKAAANRMVVRRASDVAENILAGRPPPSTVQSMVRGAGRAAAYAPPVILGSQGTSNAFLTDAYGNTYDAQGNRLSP